MDQAIYYDKKQNLYWRQANKNIPPYTKIKEIDILIMSYLNDKILYAFGIVNKYVNFLYKDIALWEIKFNRIYPNFPIAEIVKNDNVNKIMRHEMRVIKIHYSIKDFYKFSKEASLYKFEEIACLLLNTEISKWLLYQHNIKPKDSFILYRAVSSDKLNYVKFLCDDCKYEVNYFNFTQAIFNDNLEMVKYLIMKYPNAIRDGQKFCEFNKIKEEIKALFI